MNKPKNTNQALWKKLNPDQQRRWVQMYKKFSNELGMLSKIQNDVTAHNLAYLSVANISVEK
jgi:hypothetical protein